MAIDVRSRVTCSLGTVISGNIGDDYLQGSGLIKTQGSVLIAGIISPATGAEVTFGFTASGVWRQIPRKLRVLSSFADPFRGTTQVELGCKLTYLSNLKESVNWNAYDDPENEDYDEDDGDDEIIVVPIYAKSIMDKCLMELGIVAENNPLSNVFSIAEFDFSSGYVQVLSDLLVSESYFGYLDMSERLQIASLNAGGGGGAAFTEQNIIDIGPIGTGDLPGDAVTVSYNSLKLKASKETPIDPSGLGAGWEYQQDISPPTTVYLTADLAAGGEWNSSFVYIPVSTTRTYYDDWNRVTEKISEENTIGAEMLSTLCTALAASNPQRTSGAVLVGRAKYIKTTTTTYYYEVVADKDKKPPENYDRLLKEVTIVRESQDAVVGSANVNWENEEGSVGNVYLNDDPSLNIITSIVEINYETGVAADGAEISKQTTKKQQVYAYTQNGQQYIAARTRQGAYWQSLIFVMCQLVYDGTSVSTSIGRAPSGGIKPPAANIIKDELSDGDWTAESTASLELATGSAQSQLRIELSMPYAPDDRFFRTPTGTDPDTQEIIYEYYSTPSDAPEKARLYGLVQNRLLLGNRSGVSIQIPADKMPAAPFDPLYISAGGLAGAYRTNGSQWAFDSNGIVCSMDALYWGTAGRI